MTSTSHVEDGPAPGGAAPPVSAAAAREVPKAPTGIDGLDAVLGGGLPAGRPTLICGAAGCGKTLFGLTFLVAGATGMGEPGVLISFEESAEDLAAEAASLGFDIAGLVASRRLVVDHVRVERSEIEEAGEYDLEGLFVRLGHAIDTVGAKRVVLDTLEALFAGLGDGPVLRAELRRLFAWLKERGVTAVVTAERGEGSLTRHGIEEYVSDCVILLDNRVEDQVTTRRLRVVKYRGSAHGTNEYPFLIDADGISVLPVTGAGLRHDASREAVSSGVAGIDALMRPGGFFRGSSVLVSGASGLGKSILGAAFADAACRRGERAVIFALEEGPDQIVRNMESVGVRLGGHLRTGLLRIEAARPSLYGLEMHLTLMNRLVGRFDPAVVVVDPISAFRGPATEVHATLLRMVDLLKSRGVTTMFANLSAPGGDGGTEHGLSSLMDTWIGLRGVDANGERNRTLHVLKSRGMAHSNQVREYAITDAGVVLAEPYIGPGGVLTGTARLTREAEELADALRRRQEVEGRLRLLAARRATAERQVAEIRASLEAEEMEVRMLTEQAEGREARLRGDRAAQAASRGVGE